MERGDGTGNCADVNRGKELNITDERRAEEANSSEATKGGVEKTEDG